MSLAWSLVQPEAGGSRRDSISLFWAPFVAEMG